MIAPHNASTGSSISYTLFSTTTHVWNTSIMREAFKVEIRVRTKTYSVVCQRHRSVPVSRMSVLKFCEWLLLVALLYDTLTVSQTDPITNREAVEQRFLKQRKKLRVARKLNPIGSELTHARHYCRTFISSPILRR